MTDQLQAIAAQQHHLLHLQWLTLGVMAANFVVVLINLRATMRTWRLLKGGRSWLAAHPHLGASRGLQAGAQPPPTPPGT